MPIHTAVISKRLLVVAHEACAGDALFAEIHRRTGEGSEVLVLAPALTKRLQFWVNDEAVGRTAAETLLARSVTACEHEGLTVPGGDPDPLQAIDDSVQTFHPDGIVIVTHPAAAQNWLERDIVAQARDRYSLPISHVVVASDERAAVTPPAPAMGALSSGTPHATPPCSCSRSGSRSPARSPGSSRSRSTGQAGRMQHGSSHSTLA